MFSDAMITKAQVATFISCINRKESATAIARFQNNWDKRIENYERYCYMTRYYIKKAREAQSKETSETYG